MNTIDIKTIALNAAVAGAARDGNIMQAAQTYYEWLKVEDSSAATMGAQVVEETPKAPKGKAK